MSKGYLIYNSFESKILVSNINNIDSITTHKGKILINSDLQDLDYGKKLYTTKNKFYYILRPTYKDIILKITRTTNTINSKDIAHILVNTSIHKNSRVLEVGTGSGALSLFLSHFINKPILSIDINFKNLRNAVNNIKKYGDLEYVLALFIENNINKLPIKYQKYFDVVLIDLPEPHLYLDLILNVLKDGGDLVFFVPNIEQVKESREIFSKYGFVYFRTYEIIEREWLIRDVGSRPYEKYLNHSMFLTFAKKIQI
ncbi:MAG: methyltransferase domain-containing protein [bacterium]|jgi:tRNA (adenine57-N1/adenine58-N1)-methyltransferase